jgi:hypothetical protein
LGSFLREPALRRPVKLFSALQHSDGVITAQHRIPLRRRRGPQVMATLRNMAVSLLHVAGTTRIARTLQAFSRDRTRILDVIPL